MRQSAAEEMPFRRKKVMLRSRPARAMGPPRERTRAGLRRVRRSLRPSRSHIGWPSAGRRTDRSRGKPGRQGARASHRPTRARARSAEVKLVWSDQQRSVLGHLSGCHRLNDNSFQPEHTEKGWSVNTLTVSSLDPPLLLGSHITGCPDLGGSRPDRCCTVSNASQ